MRAELLETPVTVNVAAGVTLSLTVKANAAVDVPKLMSCPTIDVIVGGPATVNVNDVVLKMPAPFITVNVILHTPLFPVTGFTVTVRVAPLPAKTIFKDGTSVVLLETPDTVSAADGVIASPTVKDNAEVDVEPKYSI